MSLQKILRWPLPAYLRDDETHPAYYQLFTVVVANVTGMMAMALIPLILLYFGLGTHLWTYYLGVATYLITLCSLRFTGYWRLPTHFCAAVAYYIVYTWLTDTGLIFSTNVAMLHLYIIAAILVDRQWGWISIFTNTAFLSFVYYQTGTRSDVLHLTPILGSPLYAFLMHAAITAFIGGLLAYVVRSQETSRRQIKDLQDHKINMLDEAVRKRTHQLNAMRQTVAADFHDQTGNMLAAINRQASILELKLYSQPEHLPLVRSIILNSNELYASSKDFLWNLNHDSDNPVTLFHYLTAYGQNFYNQFDIAFSADTTGIRQAAMQLDPFAALNLIYIFKEAMNNVIRHSGADEVVMTMIHAPEQVTYTLADNGQWKEADAGREHYGLSNMERRSRQSGFSYALTHNENGTCISVTLPLSIYFIQNDTA